MSNYQANQYQDENLENANALSASAKRDFLLNSASPQQFNKQIGMWREALAEDLMSEVEGILSNSPRRGNLYKSAFKEQDKTPSMSVQFDISDKSFPFHCFATGQSGRGPFQFLALMKGYDKDSHGTAQFIMDEALNRNLPFSLDILKSSSNSDYFNMDNLYSSQRDFFIRILVEHSFLVPKEPFDNVYSINDEVTVDSLDSFKQSFKKILQPSQAFVEQNPNFSKKPQYAVLAQRNIDVIVDDFCHFVEFKLNNCAQNKGSRYLMVAQDGGRMDNFYDPNTKMLIFSYPSYNKDIKPIVPLDSKLYENARRGDLFVTDNPSTAYTLGGQNVPSVIIPRAYRGYSYFEDKQKLVRTDYNYQNVVERVNQTEKPQYRTTLLRNTFNELYQHAKDILIDAYSIFNPETEFLVNPMLVATAYQQLPDSARANSLNNKRCYISRSGTDKVDFADYVMQEKSGNPNHPINYIFRSTFDPTKRNGVQIDGLFKKLTSETALNQHNYAIYEQDKLQQGFRAKKPTSLNHRHTRDNAYFYSLMSSMGRVGALTDYIRNHHEKTDLVNIFGQHLTGNQVYAYQPPTQAKPLMPQKVENHPLLRFNTQLQAEFIKNRADEPELFDAYLAKRGIKNVITQDGTPLFEKFGIGYSHGNEYKRDAFNGFRDTDYLLKTGLTSKEHANSSFLMTKRISFPIQNVHGDVIAFAGGAIQEHTPTLDNGEVVKYYNSGTNAVFDKKNEFFGIYQALPEIKAKNEVILVEGYLDCISMYGAGYENTVASMGTACGREKIQKLCSLADNITLMFDGDNAGLEAASSFVQNLLKADEEKRTLFDNTLNVKVAILPRYVGSEDATLAKGLDPDDCIQKGGKPTIQRALDTALALDDFIVMSSFQKVFDLANNPNNLENMDSYSLINFKTVAESYIKDIKQTYPDFAHSVMNKVDEVSRFCIDMKSAALALNLTMSNVAENYMKGYYTNVQQNYLNVVNNPLSNSLFRNYLDRFRVKGYENDIQRYQQTLNQTQQILAETPTVSVNNKAELTEHQQNDVNIAVEANVDQTHQQDNERKISPRMR